MTAVLETARLTLRPPSMSDLDSIVTLLNNRDIARNLAFAPHPYRREDALSWLPEKTRNPPPENAAFVIEHEQDGVIGCVGLHSGQNASELGFWLAKPFWSMGIMTEAASTVLQWYFKLTGANLVRSGYFVDNPASWRVQEKLGFKPTGTGRLFRPLARAACVDHIDTQLEFSNFTPLGRRP